MDGFRADLHCHSMFSDGSDSPFELLQKAKDAGLSGLSITDHDSIDAYTDEWFQKADSLSLRILTGVELSSSWQNQTIHILGYGFDLDSPILRSVILEIQQKRTERNEKILEKLNRCGIRISLDDLLTLCPATHVIGRPHIASVMVKKGFVANFQQAFDAFLSDGACCYETGFKLSPQEVIEAIHKANGKAVLAHPHLIKNGAHLRYIFTLPLDGLECYYSNLPYTTQKYWEEKANKKGWIPTGGSDYHGAFKPHIQLGQSWVRWEVFERLLQR